MLPKSYAPGVNKIFILTIPAPKLRAQRAFVVELLCCTNNQHSGATKAHARYFSTAALPPRLSAHDHHPPVEPHCLGPPLYEWPGDHARHLPLEWRWRQLSHPPALLRHRASLGTAALGVLPPASVPG